MILKVDWISEACILQNELVTKSVYRKFFFNIQRLPLFSIHI